jgi:hypothetical protein
MSDKIKDVFTIHEGEKAGADGKKKSYFVRIGVGYVNQDGSINLKLNALPVNGTIHVRNHESQEERERRFGGRRAAASSEAFG